MAVAFDAIYIELTPSHDTSSLRANKNRSPLSNLSFQWFGCRYDIKCRLPSHVECVVLLSQLPDEHIDIDIDLDEFDLTAAESRATYDEMKAYVLEHSGLKVSSLYISQVKRKLGLDVGVNYNKAKNKDSRVPNCPKDKEDAIVETLKRFKMI